MTHHWYKGIRSWNELMLVALLLGFVSMAFSNYSFVIQSIADHEPAQCVTFIKPAKDADKDGLLIKLLSIIEEVSEEEAEIYLDDWTPALIFYKAFRLSLDNYFRVFSLIYTRCHLAFYRNWCSYKRMPIIAEATALYLYLYHSLKLPY
jgi:hypothetical protein